MPTLTVWTSAWSQVQPHSHRPHVPIQGPQEGKPIPQGLQPGKAREDYPFKDPAKRNKGGRPLGSVNRYTGALKELFLLAAENVGDRLKIGPNGLHTSASGLTPGLCRVPGLARPARAPHAGLAMCERPPPGVVYPDNLDLPQCRLRRRPDLGKSGPGEPRSEDFLTGQPGKAPTSVDAAPPGA